MPRQGQPEINRCRQPPGSGQKIHDSRREIRVFRESAPKPELLRLVHQVTKKVGRFDQCGPHENIPTLFARKYRGGQNLLDADQPRQGLRFRFSVHRGCLLLSGMLQAIRRRAGSPNSTGRLITVGCAGLLAWVDGVTKALSKVECVIEYPFNGKDFMPRRGLMKITIPTTIQLDCLAGFEQLA